MRFDEIIQEQQVDEGPIGSAIGAVGRGGGKAIGGVAKAAGAVAGVPGGIKKAFQAGKQASTDVIGGTDAAPAATAAPATTQAAPAQQSQGLVGKIGQAVGDFKGAYDQAKAAAGGTAAPATAQPAPAPAQQAAPAPAQQAAPAQPAAPAGDQQAAAKPGTPYKAAQDAVNKLNKRGKQNILKLLQKEFPQEPAAPAPEFTDAQGGKFNINTGKPLASQAEVDAQNKWFASQGAAEPAPTGQALNPKPGAEQPAAEPAQTAAPTGRTQGSGKIAGQLSQTPGAVKKRQARAAAKAAPAVQTAGVIRTGNNLSESLAEKIEHHKRKMFEANLSTGQTSIYKR